MPFSIRLYRVPLVLIRTFCILALFLPTLVHAETKAIVSEATYTMGDSETPSFAESMALQKPKQAALEEAGTYVFHGEHPAVPWSATAVEYHWRKIRRKAGCPDVQIRDLRRTCASWLAQQGAYHAHHTKRPQSFQSRRHTGLRQLDQTSIRAALGRHAEQVIGK